MKKYRLKKEAVKFFHESLATAIEPLHEWESKGIDKNALDEVEPLRIEYGIPLKSNGNSLNGWDEKGSRFHFTLIFPSVKFYEHDKFHNGKIIRNLMDKIQLELNYFYSEFINETGE